MLVLSRKVRESVTLLGPGLPEAGVVVEVTRVAGGAVRLGFHAPRSIQVVRTELLALLPPVVPAGETVELDRLADDGAPPPVAEAACHVRARSR